MNCLFIIFQVYIAGWFIYLAYMVTIDWEIRADQMSSNTGFRITWV
jgi:hypothetical protein